MDYSVLSDRERSILQQRLAGISLREVAKTIHRTAERVRGIEKAAMKKLVAQCAQQPALDPSRDRLDCGYWGLPRLSRRTINACRLHGVLTFSDLANKTGEEMLRWKYIGRKSLRELQNCLDVYNKKLRKRTAEAKRRPSKTGEFFILKDSNSDT